MSDIYIPTPVEAINKRRDMGGTLLDLCGELPLSKNNLKYIQASNDHVKKVTVTHKLEPNPNIVVTNDNGERLPPEDHLRILGFVYFNSNKQMWIGAYYYSELDAWADTYVGADKEEIMKLHEEYIRGYEDGSNFKSSDPDEIFEYENPTKPIQDKENI